MAKDNKVQIDDELREGLQQARKTARNYLLVIKGTSVVGMIVQKKTISEAMVLKAKTDFKGNAVLQGVCVGNGGELNFEVLGAEPSLAIKKVKDFVSESADLAIKPQWVVVPAFTSVIDDDEPPTSNAPPISSVTPPVPPPPPPPPPPNAPAPGSELAMQFKQQLTELSPRYKQALSGKPSNQAELESLMAATLEAAKTSQFAVALQRLGALRDKLSAPVGNDPAARFNERLKQMLPRIKSAGGTPAGEKASELAREAGLGARKQDFDSAHRLLDEAESVLQGRETNTSQGGSSSTQQGLPPEIAPGIVEKRKFLAFRWPKIPEEVRTNLEALRDSIEANLPEEDADLLVDLSQDYLDEFCDEIKDAIDDAINEGDAKYAKAISVIRTYRAKIAQEELIQHLKANSLQANIAVESILLRALDEVEQQLAK
ncbi:MAG: hypothetical protein U0939_25360 [Pirellulales bacterium]